jgi:hypothetical protein
MTRYILVQWPESQHFIGVKGCFFCGPTSEDNCEEYDQAMFVPEDLYCKTTGMIHKFDKTVKNKELQQILAKYPNDANVAVEYCDVKSLKYHPDQNLITID